MTIDIKNLASYLDKPGPINPDHVDIRINKVQCEKCNKVWPEDYVEKCSGYIELPLFLGSGQDLPCDSCGVARSKHE